MKDTLKNKDIQDFLEKVIKNDPIKFSILEELREIVFKNSINTKERIIYGGIMFSEE